MHESLRLLPPIGQVVLAGLTQTLAIVLAKVVLAVRNSDFLANVDAPDCDNVNASLTGNHQLRIGAAVVVCEASRAHEQTGHPIPAAHDDAEVLLADGEIRFLFWRDEDLNTGQILDALVALDKPACDDARLMGCDGVSVGAADFERAVGQVDLGIPAQVLLEVEFLLGSLEGTKEPAKAVGSKQLLFGEVDVGVDNQVRLYDLCDFFLFDATGGMVRGTVLGDGGPVVRLLDRLASMRRISSPATRLCAYPVNESIRQNVIVRGQLRQSQWLLLCAACSYRRRHLGSLGYVFGVLGAKCVAGDQTVVHCAAYSKLGLSSEEASGRVLLKECLMGSNNKERTQIFQLCLLLGDFDLWCGLRSQPQECVVG